MGSTQKKAEAANASNVLAAAFNHADSSLTTAPFVTGLVGRKILKTDIDSVTEDYTHSENGVVLYTLRVTYSDSTKAGFVSVERTA